MFSASHRYWNEDIIEPAVEVTAKGTIHMPNTPGLGYAIKRDHIEKITVRRNNWNAPLRGKLKQRCCRGWNELRCQPEGRAFAGARGKSSNLWSVLEVE